MASLENQLETAKLSRNCKIDLMNHVEQIEFQTSLLPKRLATVTAADLPAAVSATTTSHARKCQSVTRSNDASERYHNQKQLKTDTLRGHSQAASQMSSTYFKPLGSHLAPQETFKNPFCDARNREQLTGKDEDFVHRYAEALSKSSLPREPKADEASAAAVEAYRKAFCAYTGREPTPKELEEVNRLTFGFTENGDIGVTQKPHSCLPHSHITCCNRRVCKCNSQIYKSEAPTVRSARDRFPGPVPVWSSTKNTYTMVGGDMHQSGHQLMVNPKSSAMNTMVAPK